MDTWKDRIYGCYVTETREPETEIAEAETGAANEIALFAANSSVSLTERYGKW